MIIQLNSLHLLNFQAIRNLTVEFNEVTNISSDNGLGKTTIFNAFCFLMWGKDSHGSSDFNIKTLVDGVAIPDIDHQVTGVLTVDGQEITLRRNYRERWTRRRGSETSELTGHETLFYVNDVPMQAKEYAAKIDSIVNEGLFKLLTSTLFFNSMKWQDRRQVLINMAGNIEDSDILSQLTKGQASDITAILNSGKPLADYRKEIAMRKKKLSDDLKLIPARVDECVRGIPATDDFDGIQFKVDAKQQAITEIEGTITDQVTAYKEQGDKIQAVQADIFKLKKVLQDIEYKAKSAWQEKENEHRLNVDTIRHKVQNAQSQLDSSLDRKKAIEIQKDATSKKVTELRSQWNKVNEETITIDPNSLKCPTCGTPYSEEIAEEKQTNMRANFTADQSKRLNNISREGKQYSEIITKADKDIEAMVSAIETWTSELETWNAELKSIEAPIRVACPDFTSMPEYKSTSDKIASLELSIVEIPKLDVEGLKSQKKTLQDEIYQLQGILGHKDVIARGEARKKQLMDEEKSLAQQISDLEKKEFACDSYDKAYMNTVEDRINGRFKIARFRMFSKLINGGSEPCCDTLVNGVPYEGGLNSAAKIQVGIDIINTLSEHYNLFLPCFIDNRESTNEIPKTKSQIINLIVTKDKQLVIR